MGGRRVRKDTVDGIRADVTKKKTDIITTVT